MDWGASSTGQQKCGFVKCGLADWAHRGLVVAVRFDQFRWGQVGLRVQGIGVLGEAFVQKALRVQTGDEVVGVGGLDCVEVEMFQKHFSVGIIKLRLHHEVIQVK